jgi:YHS domain-containing protein
MADEAYIRQSILDPNSRTVAGYPRLMPSYRGQLSDQEVSQLTDYIKSLAGTDTGELLVASTQPTPPGQSIDPVCKMLVAAHDPTLHSDYQGITYYFCSTTCRDQFLKDPPKFIAQLAAPTSMPSTQP